MILVNFVRFSLIVLARFVFPLTHFISNRICENFEVFKFLLMGHNNNGNYRVIRKTLTAKSHRNYNLADTE